MKYILPIILIAGCQEYSQREKIAFSAFCASAVGDAYSTRQVLQSGGRETNLCLSDRPDDLEIVSLKIAQAGIIYLLGELWPEHREAFWWAGTGVNGYAVIHNRKEKTK